MARFRRGRATAGPVASSATTVADFADMESSLNRSASYPKGRNDPVVVMDYHCYTHYRILAEFLYRVNLL